VQIEDKTPHRAKKFPPLKPWADIGYSEIVRP
jgi:hypothetical protein